MIFPLGLMSSLEADLKDLSRLERNMVDRAREPSVFVRVTDYSRPARTARRGWSIGNLPGIGDHQRKRGARP